MPDDETGTRMARLAGTAAAVIAATLAQRLISAGWQAVRGHKPPSEENTEAGIGLAEVIAAAVVTGAIVAVVRVLATRGTTRVVARLSAKTAD